MLSGFCLVKLRKRCLNFSGFRAYRSLSYCLWYVILRMYFSSSVRRGFGSPCKARYRSRARLFFRSRCSGVTIRARSLARFFASFSGSHELTGLARYCSRRFAESLSRCRSRYRLYLSTVYERRPEKRSVSASARLATSALALTSLRSSSAEYFVTSDLTLLMTLS